MLPAEHRIRTSQDFRAVMKSGSRAGTSSVAVSVLVQPVSETVRWRCGLIVLKAVGNAVSRHRASRRLRHIVRNLMVAEGIELPEDKRVDMVIRASAALPHTSHEQLLADVRSALKRALRKAKQRESGQRESGQRDHPRVS